MEVTGTIVLFKKFKDMPSDSEFNNCRVPTNKNFVFSGLINSEFLQHQGEGQSQVYVWHLTLL